MRYPRIAFLALTLGLLVLVAACTEDDVVEGRRIEFYAEEPLARIIHESPSRGGAG